MCDGFPISHSLSIYFDPTDPSTTLELQNASHNALDQHEIIILMLKLVNFERIGQVLSLRPTNVLAFLSTVLCWLAIKSNEAHTHTHITDVRLFVLNRLYYKELITPVGCYRLLLQKRRGNGCPSNLNQGPAEHVQIRKTQMNQHRSQLFVISPL